MQEAAGRLAVISDNDVDVACRVAQQALDCDPWQELAFRLKVLERLQALVLANRKYLSTLVSREIGVPVDLAYRYQLGAALSQLSSGILTLQHFQWEVPVRHRHAVKIYQPIGVCGLITPWNWPFLQSVAKLVPALGSGCTVVHKPSEYATDCARKLAELIHEAGVPTGVYNLVCGPGQSSGAALVQHPIPRMISFTGSTATGKVVSRIASGTLKRVTLELGGKSPYLVFADCDLQRVIRRGVRGCFSHSGQSCNAPTRMLVEQSVYEQAQEIAQREAQNYRSGDPSLPGRHLGPLVNEAQYKRVQKLIQSGIDEGATLLIGGLGRAENAEVGWFVRPTIFTDVRSDMRIVSEEIFGPVLCMQSFSDDAEAIKLANDTEYGLAAYVNTADKARARRIALELEAGMVLVNGATHSSRAPFGGIKQSGSGREYSEEGLLEYLEVKVISE